MCTQNDSFPLFWSCQLSELPIQWEGNYNLRCDKQIMRCWQVVFDTKQHSLENKLGTWGGITPPMLPFYRSTATIIAKHLAMASIKYGVNSKYKDCAIYGVKYQPDVDQVSQANKLVSHLTDREAATCYTSYNETYWHATQIQTSTNHAMLMVEAQLNTFIVRQFTSNARTMFPSSEIRGYRGKVYSIEAWGTRSHYKTRHALTLSLVYGDHRARVWLGPGSGRSVVIWYINRHRLTKI